MHKVAALVAARIEQGALQGHLPDGVRTKLEGIRQDARQQAERARQTLRDLADHFGRAGVPFLVIKGSVLAELIYHDPMIRRFFDVDVVVPPARLGEAEALLRSWGYRIGQVGKLLTTAPRGKDEERDAEALTQRFYERFEYELPLVPPASDQRLAVDVHWHVAPPSRLHATAQQLWEQTAAVVVADTAIQTFNPEATLIHLAVHATTCSFAGFRLLHLCDVAWAASAMPPPYDRLWQLARAWGVDAHLDTVLDMTERVLSIACPPGLRLGRRPRGALNPWFRWATRAVFLVSANDAEMQSGVRRAWNELVWSLGMQCLGHNVQRSLRVRVARLRWEMLRRRLG